MKFFNRSLDKFFSFFSSAIAPALLGFSVYQTISHGKYGFVAFSDPLLCLCKRSFTSLVWPM